MRQARFKIRISCSATSSLRCKSVAESGQVYDTHYQKHPKHPAHHQHPKYPKHPKDPSHLSTRNFPARQNARSDPPSPVRRARQRAGSSKFFSPSLASTSVFHFFPYFPVLAVFFLLHNPPHGLRIPPGQTAPCLFLGFLVFFGLFKFCCFLGLFFS